MTTRTFLLLSAVCGCLLPIMSGAGANQDPFSMLVSNSPFGAAAANGAAPSPTGESIEFRSVVVENGRTLFSLHDPAARQSVWLALHEEAKGFSVQAYDDARDRLTVAYQGRVLTLPLKRAIVAAQTVPAPTATAAVAKADKPGAAGTTSRKTQAELIREEIARRRAQRGLPQLNNQPPGSRG